ncbi:MULTISPECIES: Dam family site-specific DNA-(adenine-N6)-methyltransferase [Mammaliicoccus]|uniref:Site-specific DNA-methyltransferase (adenine-specific) n=1 Tax=Mammaliicoccus sciuri TaxID=1296 RepID=A0ABT7HZY5_MAMSC|nr:MULTISPECIES: Dam family site-specific DNA-(adenine-N6)-methyltransferase [Mammaliicoccus]MCJ0914557.1 Dam family site-specific DNA-(adenine-N6)-methyltransferase [Mammaliicoccus sciuri]MDL0112652.1 Dam family site-specific DNA-(adenine-N6)-methyltransferase [Mammaliicoccus sciuri]MDL0117228.1 Dam family site-specific DNA-(adenine-N6)-methyltransferase [Mammaliicoccus sciuri]WQJ65991.1 Dam family site-specific DNA-(adenine-N6)-methyltransferase [Mammaliicoccus sciuri]
MINTKQIMERYNVSRQTLMNWINTKSISMPNKDWRGWYIWSESNILEIEKLIAEKKRKAVQEVNESNEEDLNIYNRRYLGSKRRLLSFIEEVVSNNTKNVNTVADIFGGTGVVSELFRNKGHKIIINDILQSNYVTYKTWFGNEKINKTKVQKCLNYLNEIEGTDNYVSKEFGDKYFSMENARKIGSIREAIEKMSGLNDREKAFLITSLIYAMDKVANTVGHYDAYRKNIDMTNKIYLKMPKVNLNRDNEIYCTDANELVKNIHASLVYIDTPYNSRQYGDAYHLLENIVEWEKPEVTGVARKMIDRSKTKSDYSTNKAPLAFEDLIQNINAKYILVSYNNMANKGNGRSNAKISNEEIINILKRKGKVKIFETKFQSYTTGKSKIEDHKEILYLCEVNSKIKKKKIEYTTSAINYTGSKYKLLNQIIPLFPETYDDFIDLFAGGSCVAINSNPKNKILINDSMKPLINLYRYLSISEIDDVLKNINELIDKYHLSKSSDFGYDFYEMNSSKGLGDYNRPGYTKLRADYNANEFNGSHLENIALYLLSVFGFNNQIRFNKKGEFNLPVGKRDFNDNMVLKLKKFMKVLHEKDIIFSSDDFRDVIPFSENTFIYADPPYSITTATYTENNGWSKNDDEELFTYLDQCDKNGIKFALSNVIQHKGIVNEHLLKWADKYNIHYLNHNYNNSNYQSSAKNKITHEVLITNY